MYASLPPSPTNISHTYPPLPPPLPLSLPRPFTVSPSVFRFNIYILDYCKKRGFHKTASQLVSEADIAPESKPPINAQQGLLFEYVPLHFPPSSLLLIPASSLPHRWWSVFWVLFQAKNSGSGSDDAILYHKVRFRVSSLFRLTPP